MSNENTKLCETCRHPYESEDHLCREAMPASDGGPAFPVSADVAGMERLKCSAMGMSLRQYAAIHLRVPDSGVDWLDEMIRKAQRDELAAKAMQGMLVTEGEENGYYLAINAATRSYEMADAMLRARESAPAADPVREAAPDLLAALKSMNEAFRVDQTRFTASQADAVRKMDAAIARATGQEG